ncbi:MAG: sulfatase [Candidatus Hydrogenedentes bacterium]|nr:sulfatase [Candidatus Hydrogenedentota bacterium]
MSTILLPVLFAALAAPNVVFISVDTLRADHLGAYGFHRNTTPHLDRLAEQSLLFEDALCEQPQTGPSMIAMLASRVPRVTGAIRNGVPLPPGTPTAPMIFESAGYQTAAIVSNWNLKPKLSGLDRGFQHYDADFGRGFLGREKDEIAADEVTDRALAWLAQRDTARPMFFWVHYMDPHAPYKKKRGFEEQLGMTDNTRGRRIDPPEDRYQTEVAFADQQIGRLLDALPRENTFIVFTADHGEGLGEHNEWGHSRYLYQTTMHIPLFIHGPGVAPGRSDAPVRGIDIGPTLLGLAGLAAPESMQGQNLQAALPQSGTPREVETYGGGVPDGEDVREALATRPPDRQAIVIDGWKLIRNEGGARELYNLRDDPEEEHNRVEDDPERAADLEATLETWHRETPRNQSTAEDLSDEDLRMLEAQGYL